MLPFLSLLGMLYQHSVGMSFCKWISDSREVSPGASWLGKLEGTFSAKIFLPSLSPHRVCRVSKGRGSCHRTEKTVRCPDCSVFRRSRSWSMKVMCVPLGPMTTIET